MSRTYNNHSYICCVVCLGERFTPGITAPHLFTQFMNINTRASLTFTPFSSQLSTIFSLLYSVLIRFFLSILISDVNIDPLFFSPLSHSLHNVKRYSVAERRAVRAEGLLCFLNRSQCSLKRQKFKMAKRDAQQALAIDRGG